MNEDRDEEYTQGNAEHSLPEIPEDALIILPVRGTVLFPGAALPLTLGRKRSVTAAQEAVRRELPLGILLQREPDADDPSPADLHPIGTVASVLRLVSGRDGTNHIVCQGEQRFRIVDYLSGYPFFVARVERLAEPETFGTEVEARMQALRGRARELMELLAEVPGELMQAIEQVSAPGMLADILAAVLDLEAEDKQEILATVDLKPRLDRLLEKLSHRLEVMRLSQEIGRQTQQSVDQRQREYMLREQLKTIQKELGEGEGQNPEVAELREAIEQAGMPEEAREQADKELSRLEHMPEAAAEYSMIRTYLDWLTELPWSVLDEESIDIPRAREILEADHYGLDKVKRRILEYLAVRKLNPEGRSPILCFVGPPGVGKTSLGQSIARALGIRFVRQSLGGTHDEAEIRGHRRTYIGALPGNIIQGIRKAGTRNPLFMLDELDKLGASFHGDPSSALLEVLDPEQNNSFRDNYLGVPFDLSKVLFVGTANVPDNIPGPLLDRMEVISLPGYTENEKREIAKRYLVARQLRENGLEPDQIEITDAAIAGIIRGYTREAGCRNLEREIGAVCRHVAVRVAEGAIEHARVDADDLHDILGPRRFENEVAMRTSIPGVATGLAWTPSGGDILFVEVSRVPGKGSLILTGQLGEVMKESAQAALSLVKGRAERLGLDGAMFDRSDIHMHVPAGAIPKDGPSAGVAMYTAMVSLLSGRTARTDTAMTGEISLRGQVLPVGGIKEKVVAAAAAGIERVLLPARNRKDVEDIPEDARRQVELIWLEQVEDAVEAALAEEAAPEPA